MIPLSSLRHYYTIVLQCYLNSTAPGAVGRALSKPWRSSKPVDPRPGAFIMCCRVVASSVRLACRGAPLDRAHRELTTWNEDRERRNTLPFKKPWSLRAIHVRVERFELPTFWSGFSRAATASYHFCHVKHALSHAQLARKALGPHLLIVFQC